MFHPQVVKWAEARVHVVSDSVLCSGAILETAEAVGRWKGQLMDIQTTVSEQFYGIDGEPIEFE